MIFVEQARLTKMEAKRPKEKPTHRSSAVTPVLVPQFSAALLYCALGKERELEVKLYEQGEAITEAKPWAGIECSHGAGTGGRSSPQRGDRVPIPQLPTSGTLKNPRKGTDLLIVQFT